MVLFVADSARCVELEGGDLPRLQRFLEANPEYYLAVNGAPPGPDEAREELASELPAGWAFGKRWLLGFEREDGALVGMANVISDLFADRVWHIGMFIVATPLHGRGTASALYDALEEWMRQRGARWSRLGVVVGNARAERFWEKTGYCEVRRRLGVPMGTRVNDLRVMVKPLGGGELTDYFQLVERDRPDSP